MDSLFAPTDIGLASLTSSDAALMRAKSGIDAKKLQDIEKAADDFEAVFLNEMLSSMFDTCEVDPTFGGGQAEETWRSLMVEQYSKNIVGAGGIGLSGAIKAQMIAMQENAQ